MDVLILEAVVAGASVHKDASKVCVSFASFGAERAGHVGEVRSQTPA